MSQLAGLQFGSGDAFATPTGGNLPLDPTPQHIGVIQDAKVTFSGDIKSLFGQQQWAVDSAVGKRSIKGTINFAQLSNQFLNQLFFADSIASGIVQTTAFPGEAHAIPASTPYTVIIAPPSSGTFVADQGVVDATTGKTYVLIPTGTPTTGQYTVASGTYTFAAADAGKAILINYTYTATTTGTTLTVSNHLMGYGPIVSLNLVFPYDGIGIGMSLPNVRLGKIDFGTKIDDYAMLSTDFEAFAGATNVPATFYQAW